MAGAVYWVGNDGNIWLKDSAGTRNAGSAQGIARPDASGFYDPWASEGETPLRINAQQIANPSGNPGGRVQSAQAPAGGGGSVRPVLNDAAIRNTQSTIDQIPGLLEAALATERTRYGNAVNEFNAAEQAQQKVYTDSTNTNQNNFDSNFMASIRAGIKGLGGLMNILRGTGAGGGSVDDDVREIVGGVTANDIRTGADTQQANQREIDGSFSNFKTDLGRKRRVNEDAFTNNERAIRRDSNSQLQELFGKMAGYYADGGRTAEANSFMDRAGALTPSIAQDSRTQMSTYDTTPVAVKAPELTAFAAPTQPNVVAAPSDGQVGSGIFTIGERRRREPAMAGV